MTENTNTRQKSSNEGEPEGFAEFWSVYPRRIAKGQARRAWATARRKGASIEQLVSGAAAYAQAKQGEDPRYIKHASTWLNGECWEDEIEVARPLPKGAPALQRFLARQEGTNLLGLGSGS